MHYTSVPNIMKVIKPLFLDDLYDALEKAKGDSKKLRQLLKRISQLKIFDPACGSGNFLIIAYKELRMLEIEIWEAILDIEDQKSFIYTRIHLTQFYGIEIDDFAHEIAKLSLWLAEHQMNKYFEAQLEQGKSNPILPLKSSGNITHANATRIDWEKVCPKEKNDEIYLLGNPPYLGSRKQKKKQKDDLKINFGHLKRFKDLDYISIWFLKGALFITNTKHKLAFVSTNSICQGLQVSLLWPHIFEKNLIINFAYPSFKWQNSAKSNAGVTVIIIGLSSVNNEKATLYNNNIVTEIDSINAYLSSGKSDLFVSPKTKSISSLPKINHGNMPADGGNLFFTTEQKEAFVSKEPDAKKWFSKIATAKEHLNGRLRWCLWLEEASIDEINSLPYVNQVVQKVKTIRQNSSRPHLAETPHLFAQITQPKKKIV